MKDTIIIEHGENLQTEVFISCIKKISFLPNKVVEKSRKPYGVKETKTSFKKVKNIKEIYLAFLNYHRVRRKALKVVKEIIKPEPLKESLIITPTIGRLKYSIEKQLGFKINIVRAE